MTLIIIPARGGSKGIPRKNLQKVGGRSLVERAITTAMEADVGGVIVSSDDQEILQCARDCGAIVHTRVGDLASDEASSEDVVSAVLEASAQSEHAILMQCTTPFTRAFDVCNVSRALENGCDSIISVTPFDGFLWSLDAQPIGHDIVRQRVRRQDRMPIYVENGALYGFRVALFHGNRFCGEPNLYVMPKWRSAEVDDLHDLQICQAMAAKVDGREVGL